MTKEELIERAVKVHGNKYVYDKVPDEFKANDRITIICPVHGEFTQCARNHYRGSGCRKCGTEESSKSRILTTESFIEKYRDKFGDVYDTSLVDYKDSESEVTMICPKHGEFRKTPHALMRGEGCPKCGRESSIDGHRLSREEVIRRANEVHGFKYNYEKYNGEKLSDEVTIICPIHGEFRQTMRKHLMGSGCRECAYEKLRELQRKPLERIIRECEEVHDHKYRYILDFEYVNNKSYLHAVCPIHGDFMQEINAHLKGQGCQKCGIEEAKAKLRHDREEVIRKAREVHGDKYSYDHFEYVNWHTPSYVTCPIHGDFLVACSNHITNGSGCPKCSHPISRWEQEIFDFISSLGVECEQSNREILNGKEIDIFIPGYNIGVECDGLRWHNELYRDKDYHLNKTNECAEKGVRLIHVFEDEWKFKREIWESMFRNMLGMIGVKIYARKCDIREVSSSDTRKFLDGNHIQGHSNSKMNYGLYYNDELVSLMTFGLPRINMGGKKEEGSYELVRFCNKLNTNVVGGASKLFRHFVETMNPIGIVSYSDKRWSLGNLYKVLGFKHTHDSKPNYFYVDGMERKNRFGFRKSVLVNEGYDREKSEHEIMMDREIYRIYDCGTMVWKWKNTSI